MIRSQKLNAIFFIGIVSSLFFCQVSFSQSYTLNKTASNLEVHGTSSLHDWIVDAEQQSGTIDISKAEDLKINKLSFSVIAESLKSGKSGMDKNTYKALNTKKHKSIDFNLSSIKNVKAVTDNHYMVTAVGDLKISGATKSISMDLDVKFTDSNVSIEGKKDLLMTDFGIDPPKALLGTIKTGNEISIVFKSVFQK